MKYRGCRYGHGLLDILLGHVGDCSILERELNKDKKIYFYGNRKKGGDIK
jgi:hypothetical protein